MKSVVNETSKITDNKVMASKHPMEPQDTPVKLTDSDIVNLVNSSGLREGILKTRIIKYIKDLNKEKKIRRSVDVLIQLAQHPCGQRTILAAEMKFIVYNKKNPKNLKQDLITAVNAIGDIIAQGFDIPNEKNIKIDWTTGKIIPLGHSEKPRWKYCEDVPVSMDKDVCFVVPIYVRQNLRRIQKDEAIKIGEKLNQNGITDKKLIELIVKLITDQKTVVSSEEVLDNVSDPCTIELIKEAETSIKEITDQERLSVRYNSVSAMIAKALLLGDYPQELYKTNSNIDDRRTLEGKCIPTSSYKDLVPLVESIGIHHYLVKNRVLKELFILNKKNQINIKNIEKNKTSKFIEQINTINKKTDELQKIIDNALSGGIDEFDVINVSKRIANSIVNGGDIYTNESDILIRISQENTAGRIQKKYAQMFRMSGSSRKTPRKNKRNRTLRGI
jgi:hypothetical protein